MVLEHGRHRYLLSGVPRLVVLKAIGVISAAAVVAVVGNQGLEFRIKCKHGLSCKRCKIKWRSSFNRGSKREPTALEDTGEAIFEPVRRLCDQPGFAKNKTTV